MNNLVPIQITLQAANAADVKQLVHDLAGTMSGMPQSEIPATTEVSALPPATPTPSEQAQQAFPSSAVPVNPGFPGQAQQQSAQQFPQQTQQTFSPTTTTTQVPTTAPSYGLDQLGVAAGPLVDAGRGPEMTAWLQQHGAQALTQLNPSLYGEFATYLRSLGAKI
ncbi:hypothetical protein P9847_18555 [Paenibacillus chibensis]|uniref:Uncharacterized protein n=1 Tax=Paenibacillus chibensis TaxID=59846 RepID=A0ABU6PWN6_9BACL|nr:hypothetical protein [Paenibacillus chibensis]